MRENTFFSIMVGLGGGGSPLPDTHDDVSLIGSNDFSRIATFMTPAALQTALSPEVLPAHNRCQTNRKETIKADLRSDLMQVARWALVQGSAVLVFPGPLLVLALQHGSLCKSKLEKERGGESGDVGGRAEKKERGVMVKG